MSGKGQRELRRIERLLIEYRMSNKNSFKSCDLSKHINKTPHSVWVYLRNFEDIPMTCVKDGEEIKFTIVKTNSNRGAVWNIVDIPQISVKSDQMDTPEYIPQEHP
jgi:hypothetical protein